MAENVYSELACTEQACPERSRGSRSVEPILYYGDNYEHRTGKAIHKRGPLGFLGYNRWPYFLFNLSACPCFCPCQSVSMKYSAAISKMNRLTLYILTRLSCGGPGVIARPKAVAISYSLCSYALVLWSLPAFAGSLEIRDTEYKKMAD